MRNGDYASDGLTAEQKACVNFDSGDLLIKGVAGSGKSYVILKRAVKLFGSKLPNESIEIFTYTNTLVNYTDELVSAKVGDGNLTVSTIDRYCTGLYREIYDKSFYVSKKEKGRELIEDALEKYKLQTRTNHRLFDVGVPFFEEEFQWIKEKCIQEKTAYLSASRKGRGSQIRLSAADRKLVWGIYSIFMEEAERHHYNSWPDLYIALNNNLEQIPEEKRIDYVLIDEAQDMTVGKLKVMRALTRKSLTIAADMAQKIYKTSFTWKEVGIDISGRSSKSLTKSFRSTKQIVMLAEDLMKINREQAPNSDEYTKAVLPEREGHNPRLVKFGSIVEENIYLIKLLEEYLLKPEVIGIICRTEKDVNKMAALLAQNGLPYEIVKRNSEFSLLRPGIKIVTAHSSKGLEFERVIIPYLHDDKYPLQSFRMEESQLDEHLRLERSLLYVAMTRARSTLVMLCVDAAKSRFVDEFESEHMEVENVGTHI